MKHFKQYMIPIINKRDLYNTSIVSQLSQTKYSLNQPLVLCIYICFLFTLQNTKIMGCCTHQLVSITIPPIYSHHKAYNVARLILLSAAQLSVRRTIHCLSCAMKREGLPGTLATMTNCPLGSVWKNDVM